ncbi:acetyl-CoA carboxylase biotin carboxylase subunit [Salsuginibacillus halophilus]|uniref:biotin carboxylase n=1 Tax=Salsuginibacillus halophilus TaxID=517424 RepID=A0A2P8HG39_9BACI|nr:acetyl-CoA carboxylase biotin carboxylase subunit [Salsuginibacillus halophilus]PSL45183.1 acetyl-CoA carboxylase biotin carboxylase subunit [Salsuginibacillus halophilus]
MFQKVLIANRGEIARRVIRACREEGIQSVAVYSDADAEAPHVREADAAVRLGPANVKESYLNVDAVIAAAKAEGVDAVHPGYGLLSENGAFARRVQAEGMTFIGPAPDIMELMGSKLEARKQMKAAGVPVIPGTEEAAADEDAAARAAADIGYPVMLKASAGGGGIGMQLVQDEEELRKAFAGNQHRAEQFFGDGAMYVEKALIRPRHVEIQLLADAHGNVIYAGERDCSIQRRNQKVVEEAPAPHISDGLRKKMGEASVKAAEKIGYTNAGTVEFLVDEHENFYFLEMNTRLQVEHPVTEEVTGIDLVRSQLAVAAGEVLSYSQNDISLTGHAIEVRIYAEDPERFLPSPGTIQHVELPEGEGIRHECWVESGTKVTPYYDPMLAKMISRGGSRAEAVERMQTALKAYEVEGIKTNIPFLIRVMESEAFQTGELSTSFIEEFQRASNNA